MQKRPERRDCVSHVVRRLRLTHKRDAPLDRGDVLVEFKCPGRSLHRQSQPVVEDRDRTIARMEYQMLEPIFQALVLTSQNLYVHAELLLRPPSDVTALAF